MLDFLFFVDSGDFASSFSLSLALSCQMKKKSDWFYALMEGYNPGLLCFLDCQTYPNCDKVWKPTFC